MSQIRVRQLADELSVGPEQVIEYLETVGRKVRGPSAVVGESLAARVRGRFRAPSRPADRVEAEPVIAPILLAPPATMAAAPVPVPVGGHGGLFLQPTVPAQPAPPQSPVGLSTNPFLATVSVPSATAAAALGTQRLPSPPEQAAPAVVELETDETRALAIEQRWRTRGFAADDQADWMAAGVRETEADLATRAQDVGISPDVLRMKLSGRTALQRLRDGESSTSVWARIQEALEDQRPAGTKLSGRFRLA